MNKLFLFLLTIMLPMVANAHDIEVANGDGITIYYNYINNATELAVSFCGNSYDSYSNEYTGNLVIPDEVTYMNRTCKVTSIGYAAFALCSDLISIAIPNSVTSIDIAAFYGCSSLTSVTPPNNLTSIGDNAFYQCSSLTSFTIPNSVKSIGTGAFSHCTGLTSVTIGNSVTSIGDYAFFGCSGLTSITIPNSVKSIDTGAFQNCTGLTSITIPNSVKSIGTGAFQNCTGLTAMKVEDGNTEYDSRDNCNAIIHTKSNSLISGCENSVIPNSVTSIGDYAFSGCFGLTTVTIPNSVVSIGKCAFIGCFGLTSVTIPNSVKRIETWAFCGCSGLISVTIGNSVWKIGDAAFGECSKLTSIIIPNSVTNIGNNAFNGCSGLISVTIGNSVRSIGSGAFDGADIPTIISLIENPFRITGKTSNNTTFSLNTFKNATLYVPTGTFNKYKTTDGWKDFVYIEESGSETTPKKCEKPTIGYKNGKLTFTSSTENATYQYSITDSDIKAGSGNEVQLAVTYNISVYATKEGYDNSETATATLCWIDAAPQTEGITDGMAQIAARPVLVKTNNGFITVEGIDDRTNVSIFSTDGKQLGSAISKNNVATIATSIQSGSIAIVKVGEKAIKVIMK